MRKSAVPLLLVFMILLFLDLRATREPVDFVAFRCASTAVRLHADPYVRRSTESCERTTLVAYKLGLKPGLVIPAPLPPYALAVLEPIGLPPPRIALGLWNLILVAAYGGIVILLRERTSLPYAALIAATAAPILLIDVSLGQPVPIFIVALLFAQRAVIRGEPLRAVAAASVTMIEPHMGLPVLASLFVIEPRARIAVAACLGGLALLNFGVAPVGTTVAYLHHVLPMHALSEVHNDGQYSLTHMLSFFGVPDAEAVLAGSIDYACMVALAVVLAAVTRGERARRSVALPIAAVAAVCGGTYMHMQQIGVAVPLALLLLAERGAAQRPASRANVHLAIIAALAMPISLLRNVCDAEVYAISVFLFATANHMGNTARRGMTALVVLLIALRCEAIQLPSPDKPVAVHAPAFAVDPRDDDPDEIWGRFVSSAHTRNPVFSLVSHLPINAAIVTLIVLSVRRARYRETPSAT